jgi:XTP/dITP diphosphohydrolase
MKMQKIYLASGNPHKVRELQELADRVNMPLEFRSVRELGGMPEVVEDTGSFRGNAQKKARAILSLLPANAWALADDSGICVDALGGAPGVESAYFAGPGGDDGANLRKLVAVMRGKSVAERKAHYVCLLYLHCGDAGEFDFRGECYGTLADDPTGTEGFGYDPLFIPDGFSETLGLLSATTKRQLSHRAKAWTKLVEWWQAAHKI